MATRTPKGTVARTTPKTVAAKPSATPPAAKPVAAPVAAPKSVAEPVATPVVETPVVPPAAPEVAAAAPVADVAPVTAPVAPPVAAAAPVEPPAAPKAVAKPAVKPAAPKPAKTVATPAAAPAAPAPVAAPKPVLAVPAAKDVDQALAYAKEKVEKMSKQVFATFDDVAGFHKENVDAFVSSSQILAKGLESLSKEIAAFNQAQYEQSVSAAKAFMAVKSVKELVDLQTEFAKTAFDALVAEATKVSEAGFKVANEAAEPLTARVNATVEKLSKVKAA